MSSIHPRSEPTVRCCCPFVKTRRTVPAGRVGRVPRRGVETAAVRGTDTVGMRRVSWRLPVA